MADTFTLFLHIKIIKSALPGHRKTDVTISVDCVMGEWGKWSSCCREHDNSNVGRKKRTRKIKTPPKNGGKECGEEQQEEPCHQYYYLSVCSKTWEVVWQYETSDKKNKNEICVGLGKTHDMSTPCNYRCLL